MANNVLYLSYNGLLEPILSSQAIPYLKELAKRGFEFTLLTYEKRKDMRRVGADKMGTMRDDLKRSGIDWHFLHYHKRPAVLSTLFDLLIGMLYCLYIIPRKKINIVHVRGVTPGSIMIFLSRIFRVKTLFDMRGRLAEEMAAGLLWKEQSLPFRLVKTCESRLLKTADAVAVLTDRHLKLIRSADLMKARQIPLDMIPCCVDMNRFNYDTVDSLKFKERLGLKDKFVILYHGKMGTFYLIDEMLDFYKVMLKIVPNAFFFVLTTDDANGVIKKALGLGIEEGRMMVERDAPFELIPKYLTMADAGLFFINPYNKLGSSPIKLGEFLASGVPVIINPGVGDTEDIVRENKAGVVVADFDKADYEKAVYELQRLKEEGEVLKKRCREAARKYLSLDDGINKYHKIYKALL